MFYRAAPSSLDISNRNSRPSITKYLPTITLFNALTTMYEQHNFEVSKLTPRQISQAKA